jgi:GTP cyclohydrolase FolE2
LGASLLDASELRVTIAMPFAVDVEAPASGRLSSQVHDVELEVIHADGITRLGTTVATDITTLCPCSKAISDYGAHNQRSRARVRVWGEGDDLYPVTVRRLAEILRNSGSAPVLPLVKRPDERVLTMAAHDHPRFAEDIVRLVSADLRAMDASHEVSVRNLESIHSHDAVACVTWSAT